MNTEIKKPAIELNQANYSFQEVITPAQMSDCFRIRAIVFITEQKVAPLEEIDGLDNVARHFLLYKGQTPIATMRLFTLPDKKAFRFGRVAVLKEFRHEGIGKMMLEGLIKILESDHKGWTIMLDSQVQALGFYEKLGFEVTSNNVFLDANIPHVHMSKVI